MLTAARGGGLKFAGNLVTAVGAVTVQLILTRFLGATLFGQYRLGVVFVEVLGRVAGLGLQSSSVRFIPIAARRRDHATISGLLQISLGMPLLVGLAFGTATFLGAGTIAERAFHDPDMAGLLRLFSPSIPLLALIFAGEANTRAFNNIRFSIYGQDLAFYAVRIAATLAVLVAGYRVMGAAAAHVLALGVSALLLVYLVHRIFPITRSPRTSVYPMRQVWQQSLPVYATHLLNAFGGTLETLMLGFFGLVAGAGIFSVALSVSRLSELFFISLVTVSLPIISDIYTRDGPEQLAPFYRAVTRWAVIVTLPIFSAIVMYAEPVLSIFGREFVAGRLAVVLLCCAPLIKAGTGVSGGILVMTGHARLNTLNAAVYLVATIALDLVLIPRFEVLGAAVAALATIALVNILRLLQVFWLFRLWPYDRQILKPVVAIVLASALSYGFERSVALPYELLEAFLGMLILGGAYAGLLALFRLSAEDRLILGRMRQRLGRKVSFR